MHDFIAIGDIVTDAFVRLKEASVHCEIDRENCTITMPFGEKIPYQSVEEVPAVGNSPNAAVAAARLGLFSALVANLGGDDLGVRCLESLKRDGVSTEFVRVHEDRKSNHHYVLWYEDDRTILVKHEEYEYALPDIREPRWVYLSSLGNDTLGYHQEIVKYLNEHPKIQLAFQPGTYQIIHSREMSDIYKRSQIFFSNIQEAEKILGIDTLGPELLLKRIREFGPEIVVLTDGPKGAYSYDGKMSLFHPPYPDPKPPLERTGAGDALASTTVAALALGQNLETAVSWGMINAMSVVQEVGAQRGLLTREKIETYLKNAPLSFKAKKLD